MQKINTGTLLHSWDSSACSNVLRFSKFHLAPKICVYNFQLPENGESFPQRPYFRNTMRLNTFWTVVFHWYGDVEKKLFSHILLNLILFTHSLSEYLYSLQVQFWILYVVQNIKLVDELLCRVCQFQFQ